MISTRLAGTCAAVALAIGILVGSAGTIVIRDAARPDAVDANAHMGQMATMMSMMAGGPAMMTGQHGMGPAGSAMLDWMLQHHQPVSSGPSR
jgi:hypothetical protein